MSEHRARDPDAYQHYTDPVPEGLAEAVSSGDCMLLAGAGLSRACLSRTREPLPDWRGLLDALVDWAAHSDLITRALWDELRQLLAKQAYAVVAQEMIDRLGESEVTRYLDEVFDPNGLSPSRRHEIIAALPFRAILTTNYDNLIERAYVDVNRRQTHVLLAEQAGTYDELMKDPHFVLKLHGDLAQPSSIILGSRSYIRLGVERERADLVSGMFRNHSVLMVGSGLSDPDVVAAVNSSAVEGNRTHYLLCRRDERNSVEKRRLLDDQRVRVIEYVDYFPEYHLHNHVETFLEALYQKACCGPLPLGVRKEIRTVFCLACPPRLRVDADFLRHYLFREGGVVSRADTQAERCRLTSPDLRGVRCLIFLADGEPDVWDPKSALSLPEALRLAAEGNVRVICVLAGATDRPPILTELAPFAPVFRVPRDFSEVSLELLRAYIEQSLPL